MTSAVKLSTTATKLDKRGITSLTAAEERAQHEQERTLEEFARDMVARQQVFTAAVRVVVADLRRELPRKVDDADTASPLSRYENPSDLSLGNKLSIMALGTHSRFWYSTQVLFRCLYELTPLEWREGKADKTFVKVIVITDVRQPLPTDAAEKIRMAFTRHEKEFRAMSAGLKFA